VGFNMVPDTTLDQLTLLKPKERHVVLSCWCLPDRRWGGLFTVSAKRLAYYTGLSVREVESALTGDTPARKLIEWDAALDLLWVPGIAAADMARCSNEKQLKGLVSNIKQAPACPLRETAVVYLMSLSHPLSNALRIALSNGLSGDLSKTLPIGFVDVDVDVDVEGGCAATDEECAAAVERVTAWTRILKGTRHEVTQQQIDNYGDDFIRAVAAVSQEDIEQMARAVRASKWLREDAGVVSFPWAIKNRERLLRGEWSPDAKR